MRYWLILHPDVKRPIGGVKQMHRLCECIARSGRHCSLIQDSENFHPSWFTSNVSTISKSSWINLRDTEQLKPETDVLVAPETFASIVFSYAGDLPIVLFNQNGSYTFGLPRSNQIYKPDSVIAAYKHTRIKQILCVSRYDFDLLVRGFGLGQDRVSCIRNGLEGDIAFSMPNNPFRIAVMPRKNSRDLSIVKSLLSQQPWAANWQLVEISSKPHAEVLSILQDCTVFLSFGHPEGFGLPVAEAMACGCAVVGYSGLGGRELFHVASQFDTALEVAYGDWVGFVHGLSHFNQQIADDLPGFAQRLSRTSMAIRKLYSHEKMYSSVFNALAKIEASCR